MLVVRDIFQLRFGKAKEALPLAKEGAGLERESGYAVGRILSDVTGEYYTLVMESQFASLADFDQARANLASSPAWGDWYARFSPLVVSGRREIFRVVD
ncbi:MAG: hypothetical protein C4332_05615 [Meiothermus sp.]